jgi:hypothetical protein
MFNIGHSNLLFKNLEIFPLYFFPVETNRLTEADIFSFKKGKQKSCKLLTTDNKRKRNSFLFLSLRFFIFLNSNYYAKK